MTLKQLFADLQNADPKNPGGWPWPVKGVALALIFGVIVAVGAWVDWAGKWKELSTAQEQEGQLKTEFLNKKQQVVNLDIIKKQLVETERAFSALLKQLPDKSQMDALLSDINQAGLGRGLQFDLFRPAPEVINGVFAEQPIAIKVTGNYDDLGQFASDISQLPRIVTLSDVSITRAGAPSGSTTPTQQNNMPLVMDATAKTYRYLDEAEIAAQKKTQGAKK
jgi:type IV pilus assembly protein PilO